MEALRREDAGTVNVRVTTGGGCETGAVYEQAVDITPGRTASIALPGPELSQGCGVYKGLYYLGERLAFAMSIATVLLLL